MKYKLQLELSKHGEESVMKIQVAWIVHHCQIYKKIYQAIAEHYLNRLLLRHYESEYKLI